MKASDIILQRHIAFGTSGMRSLVADFSPEIFAEFTTAF